MPFYHAMALFAMSMVWAVWPILWLEPRLIGVLCELLFCLGVVLGFREYGLSLTLNARPYNLHSIWAGVAVGLRFRDGLGFGGISMMVVVQTFWWAVNWTVYGFGSSS